MARSTRQVDWGWHHGTGAFGRAGGWVVVALLLVLMIENDTRHLADIWLGAIALLLALILIIDRHRRKTTWRGDDR